MKEKKITEEARVFIDKDKTVAAVARGEEVCWINPYYLPFAATDAVSSLSVSDGDIDGAEARLLRFAPFIAAKFPETRASGGIIESPLREIENMRLALEGAYPCQISGRLFLKMDSHLDIAGSVKARGGIYEVLALAEKLALSEGIISQSDDYTCFASDRMRNFFKKYTVEVGSTGNLGMSIGISAAALGFRARVHMSEDARQWKKDLLRSHGVEVIEYADEYSAAITEGRRQSDADPSSYFVDDERSKNLFLGYAVAARRLNGQLTDAGIRVDGGHPLFVYLPCGVGGAPGGIAYGLKRLYGDNVHCFFIEPTLFPSVLLGIATQRFENADVHDFGISGMSAADGLACAKPSGLVTRIMTNHLSGEFTVRDARLFDYLRMLDKSEGIRIEPSACAAFAGAVGISSSVEARRYLQANGISEQIMKGATHVVWATGGKMIPDAEMEKYLGTYL